MLKILQRHVLAACCAAFLVTALSGCADSTPSAVATLDGVVDLDGRPANPFTGDKATLLLFVRSDCPISNRYAPEIRRLHESYTKRGVNFFLLYVNPTEPVETIREHLEEYQLPGVALRDPKHSLVKKTAVSITPEAALLNSNGDLIYRGRIDNRYVDFGQTRPEATQHDLEDALAGVADGTLKELVTTKAIGCYIGDLEQAGD